MNIIWLNEAPPTTIIVPVERGLSGGELGLWDREAEYRSTPATIHPNSAKSPSKDIRNLTDLHS